MNHYVLPVRILWQQQVVNAQRLLSSDVQPLVHDPVVCVLQHTGEAPGLLLDFGRELHGALRLVTTAFNPQRAVRVRVRFGESAAEAMGITDQDHAIHSQELLVPWCGTVDVGPSGFRFARIDLIDPGATLHLRGVVARLDEVTTQRQGSFRCSDKRINAVWETAAQTVELCMQDYLWDGIKRDRLVWMGDMHPEVMVIAGLHGNHAVVPKSLDLLRDTTPLPGWMNGISSYSLWWIRTHYDWYMRTGDRAYLAEQRAYLVELLGFVAATVERDGSHRFPLGLIDWATVHDHATTVAGMHALLAWTLQAGAELAGELGEKKLATTARSASDRLLRHGLPIAATKQAAALGVLAGFRPAKEANRGVLAKRPTEGLSPFYGYYVLEARALAGDTVGGLDLLRTYWGAMLDLGATSFWEHFDLAWLQGSKVSRIDELPGSKRDLHRTTGEGCYAGYRHSLCHGWSGGPAIWLQDRVLGVTPASAGFATVRIAPQLGDLAWAEGSIPTPHGVITIRAERGRAARVVLPKGISEV